MSSHHRMTIDALAAVAIAILSWAPYSAATTMEQKTLSELMSGAELVFEGTVTDSSVGPTPNGQAIQTCVTFNVLDVISGSHPDATLVLCFLGGELNGQRMVVTDLRYPVVGEHGIYLVESTHVPMVNPLIGWDQGRFLVAADPADGAAKMTTAERRPVMGIGGPVVHAAEGGSAILPPGGAAADVSSADGPDLRGAMTRDAFKARLRAMVGR